VVWQNAAAVVKAAKVVRVKVNNLFIIVSY